MNLHQKKILSSIPSFLSDEKIQAFGVYDNVIPNTCTSMWDGSKDWKSLRRWQRKSWLFFGTYSADIFVGFAIVDAGFLGKAFCYVYRPKTGELLENGMNRPFAFEADFKADLNSYWQLGQYEIFTQKEKMHLNFKGKKFQLSIQCTNNEYGLSFLCPSTGGNRPFHSTYKNLLLPTNIQLKQKGETQFFNQLHGGIDFSKGYPPKQTNWNWTSFLGHLDDRTPVGINVVDQFNQNMENVVWVGTERILIGNVSYQYNKPLTKSTWKVRSLNGDLELSMQVKGARKENINVKFLKSKFTQVFGQIEGKIRHQGSWKKLKGYGVMEEHEAIW